MVRPLFIVALFGFATVLCGCTSVSYSTCYQAECGDQAQPYYPEAPFDDPTAKFTRRSMFISQGAGNALAANIALQTERPWPRYSNNTNIPANSARLVRAMTEFEEGTRESETAKRAFRNPSVGSGQGSGSLGGGTGAMR